MTILRYTPLVCLVSAIWAADPTAPTSVWVTSKTSTAVTMTWYGAGDVDGDIARYRISRDGTEVGTSTTTTWTDTGLQAATTYVYTIVVEDAGGRRSPSGPAMTAITRPLGHADPMAPTGVSVSGVSAHAATLTWTPVTDLDPIARYLVYVDGSLAASTANPPITLTGLANGTRSFTVKAEDSLGNQSPLSATATAAVPLDTTPPGAPTGVTAGTVTASTIAITWSAGTDDTGVVDYLVAYSRNGTSVGQMVTTGLGYVLGAENGALIPSSSYSITVSARDRAGLTAAAAPLVVATPADTTPPSTPAPPSRQSATYTALSLAWTSSSDDVAVASWELRRDGQVLANRTSMSYTDGTIVPGTAYSYTLVAIDAAGNRSAPSLPLEITTPSEDIPPPAPVGVRVAARTATTLTLDWQQDPDPGESGVVAWCIERDGVVIVERATSKPWTDAAPAGLAHTWVVTAIDRCGNRSAPSTPFTLQRGGDLVPPPVPAAPTMGATTSTSAVVNWTAVGADAIGYEILRDGQRVGDASGTTWTDATRLPATTVAYAVVAYDAAGNRSSASPTAASTTPADSTAPSKPAGLAQSGLGPSGFTLTWTPSTDNHAVSSYEVLRAGVQIAAVPAPPAVLTGLPTGTAAAYTVRAVDPSGNRSAVSSSLSVTTQADATAPSTPQRPWSTSVAPAAVALAWLASDDNVAVASYEVRRDGVALGTTPNLLFTDTTVTDGTRPAYTLVSIDAAGNRSAVGDALTVNVPIDTLRDRTAPTVPGNLRLTARTDRTVTIAWNAATDDKPAGIARYHVYRDGSEIAAPTATSYVVAGLIPEQTVSVAVCAEDAAGNLSPQSFAGLFTTLADASAPTAPSGLAAANVGVSSLDLSWQASTDDVAVASYDIFNATSNTWIQSSDGPSATLTGLPAGAAISLTVRAVDGAGNRSAMSTALGVNTLADTVPPGVPTGLTVASVEPGAVNLTWTAATDNVGIQRYDVRRGTTVIGNTTGTTWRATGLAAGTAYVFSVRAVDAANGASAYTPDVPATTAADTQPPSTPDGVAASSIGFTGFALSWGVCLDDVGVATYRIYRDGVEVTSQVAPYTSIALSGLAPGQSYAFSVKAADAAGNLSAMSPTVAVTTLADGVQPVAPGNLWVSNRTANTVTLSWDAGSDTGGSGVANYAVVRDGSVIGTPTTTSFTATGMTAGTPAAFVVRAVDAAGNVAATPPLSVTLGADATAPTQPTGLAASNITASSALLTWTASTDATGVVGYRIFRGSALVGAVAGTSFTHTGITPSSSATYTVEAVDAAANLSSRSAGVAVAALADTVAPSAPGQPAAGAITVRSATLSWTPASDDVAVKEYVVYRNGSPAATTTLTAWTDTGLAPGATYAFRVAARDHGGNLSPQSTATSVTTPADATAPAVPGLPRLTAVTTTTASFAWTAIIDDAGGTVTYELHRDGVLVQTTSATTRDDGGLLPGTTYTYSLVARDTAGNRSLPGPVLQITTAADAIPPPVPKNLSVNLITDNSARISWTVPSDGQSGIGGYRVWRNGIEIAAIAPASYWDATGLAPSTVYQFAVEAVDLAGNRSGQSVTVRFKTQVDSTAPPAPVPTVRAVLHTVSATLDWSAVPDASGIAFYHVRLANQPIQAVTGQTATVANLRPGTSYQFDVVASDVRGNFGLPGSVVVYTPPDTTPPSTPSGLTVTPVDRGVIAVAWAPSTDDSGIASYVVYRDGVEIARVTEASYTDATAPAGQRAAYQVQAWDVAGNVSSRSLAQEIAVLPDVGAPQRVPRPAITAITCTTVGLSWPASVDDVGVTAYIVLRDGAAVAELPGTTWTDTQRTPGTTHRYAIVARDAFGNRSTASNEAIVRLLSDIRPPSAPTGLRVSDEGTAGCLLSWQAGDDAGSGIAGYDVGVDGNVMHTTSDLQVRIGPFERTAGVRLSVRARDQAGLLSAWSAGYYLLPRDPATATGAPPWDADAVAPGLPGAPAASLTAEHTATVTWTASADASGIAGYLVFRKPNGGTATCLGWTSGLNWADARVPGNTAQSWLIRAVDRFGNASADATTTGLTLPADPLAPPAPANLRLASADPNAGTVRVAWDPVAPGVTDLAGWRISGLATDVPPSATTIDVAWASSLTVSAVDFHGRLGSGTLTIPAPIDSTPPVPPSDLVVRWVSDSGVCLRWSPGWDAVTASGSLSYVIERDAVEIGVTSNSTWTDTAPLAGRSHVYRVRSRDAAGLLSVTGPVVWASIPVDVVAPTGPVAVAWKSRSSQNATLEWSATSDSPGRPAPGIEIQRDGIVVATLAAGTRQWNDPYLTPDQGYLYAVTAIDAAGNRTSASATIRTLPATTAVPRNLRWVMQGSVNAILSWDPPYDVAGLQTYAVSGSNTPNLTVAASKSSVILNLNAPEQGSQVAMVGSDGTRSTATAYVQATRQQSLSILERTAPFDLARWVNDAAYRTGWLLASDPARIWRPADPGPGTPVLRSSGGRRLSRQPDGTVTITVVGAPNAPVQFLHLGQGVFPTSGTNSCAVQADATGVASAQLTPTPGESVTLVASPMASGTVRFLIRSQP